MSPSARLQTHSLIEYIDLTIESLDPFGEPAVGGDMQVHVKDPSMGPDPAGGQDDSDRPFLSIEGVQCAAADSVLPPISQIQAYSREDTLKSIGPGSSAEGKEKADINDGHNKDGHKQDGDRTATDAIGVRDPPKRTAEDAGLNEEGKVIPGSDKIRRKDLTDDADNTDHDHFMARIRSLPKPVFKYPLSLRDLEQRENIINSGRSNETGDSQENPLIIEDDDKPSENGCSARATSVESNTSPAPLQRSPPPRQPEADGYSSAQAPEPTTGPIDRPAPPSAAPLQPLYSRVVGKDDQEAAAVASPPDATPLPLFPRLPASNNALEE